jgi:hypothetical protein
MKEWNRRKKTVRRHSRLRPCSVPGTGRPRNCISTNLRLLYTLATHFSPLSTLLSFSLFLCSVPLSKSYCCYLHLPSLTTTTLLLLFRMTIQFRGHSHNMNRRRRESRVHRKCVSERDGCVQDSLISHSFIFFWWLFYYSINPTRSNQSWWTGVVICVPGVWWPHFLFSLFLFYKYIEDDRSRTGWYCLYIGWRRLSNTDSAPSPYIPTHTLAVLCHTIVVRGRNVTSIYPHFLRLYVFFSLFFYLGMSSRSAVRITS